VVDPVGTQSPVAAREVSEPLPVQDWDRYQLEGFLGDGGMGRVYKAFDPRLKRHVALKFLKKQDAEWKQRLLQEARAQARIAHPHVCEIHDVAEVGGRAYIAMQYIEGPSLMEIRSRLNVEQKVEVMRQAAEAVHAAHRLGLIHRDIKPANILVEQLEGGALHAYVMDFGLVREVESPSRTATGLIVGTPSYMAPEQARGDNRLIDRRTDVYGLGATMYEFLSGRTPFQDDSSIGLLFKILQEEPQPLRVVNPEIPRDLETITLKCMEKEPQRRYDSARAVAEDLQRYLEAEPILARPGSWLYKLARKAAKHKVVTALAAFSVVGVLFLVFFASYMRWRAMEQSKLAQQFGQEIEKMESVMRYASLLPLHDVRPQKKLVLGRMDRIRKRMQEMGTLARGPGKYALGRGYLSLHDYQGARDQFQAAWDLDYRSPELACALGQALGALYWRHLEEALRDPDKKSLEERLARIRKEYLEPALRYLKEGKTSQVESAALVEGWIAFYQKDYSVALSKADEAYRQVPWLYEAKDLRGKVYAAMGADLRQSGNTKQVLELYRKAEGEYREAIRSGSSDAAVYRDLCALYDEVMYTQMYQTGVSLEEGFARGREACESALSADPENAEAYGTLSRLYAGRGEWQMRNGVDPREALDAAVRHGQRAIALNAEDLGAYRGIVAASWTKADYESQHGMDPRRTLNLAIQASGELLRLNRNFSQGYMGAGNAYWVMADYEFSHGLDPSTSIEQAIARFEKAIELNPRYAEAYSNMGGVYCRKAEFEMSECRDPLSSIDLAVTSLRQSIRWNESLTAPHILLGQAYNDRAEFELRKGEDAGPSLDLARRSLRRAAELYPDYYETLMLLGQADLLGARNAVRAGDTPLPLFDTAEDLLRRAVKANPGYADAYVLLTDLFRRKAEQRIGRGESPAAEVRDGLAASDRALEIKPDLATALASKGILLSYEARALSDPRTARSSLRRAEQLLRRALRDNPHLRCDYEPRLQQMEAALQSGSLSIE
jgi:tetratricopeptide (TPR) repeat protein/tRNA A-37 threonylcarbamoyl transferase component Bud32